MKLTIRWLISAIIIFLITSANASEMGLLLGLRQGTNYDISATLSAPQIQKGTLETTAYRTFWLRAQEDKIELAAEKTSLLVPRSDGFWRLDVKHSTYNNFTEDFLWINPAPDPDGLPNPFLAEQEGIKAFDIAMLVKEQGIEIPLGEYCHGHALRDILFVGSDYLSVGYIRNETCHGFIGGSADSALLMLAMDDLESVNISSLLEAEASTAFIRMAKELQEQYGETSGEWGDLSGGIVREAGQWAVKGHFPIDKNKYTHFSLPVAPTFLMRYDTLLPDWATIKTLVPQAIDAFSAPNEELLVVLTKTSLLVFTVADGKISSQAALQLYLKQPVNVVMARWAEGQYVMNWTQEIQNMGPDPKQSWLTDQEILPVDETLKLFGVVVSTTPTLNIRQSTGQDTKPIAQVKAGAKLPILDILGQWYQVKSADKIGYVHRDYLQILPKLPYIQTGCPINHCTYGTWDLKKSTLLYSKPSREAEIVTTLTTGQQIQALGGETHTLRYGEIEVVKPVTLTEDNHQLELQPGERLFDLEFIGSGMHALWYDGGLYYLSNGWEPMGEKPLWGKEMVRRETDWWVNVQVPQQSLTGWIVIHDK
jgi:hypothetical protein